VADHHVCAFEPLELRVDQRCRGLVAERRARVGEVRERREPERLVEPIEPVGGDPFQLPPRFRFHAELDEQRNETGSPGSLAAPVARENPDHRSKLGQASLLAADAERLDPEDPRGVPPRQQVVPFV
jgi:hypothetical protein